jgi:hypothetical protein
VPIRPLRLSDLLMPTMPAGVELPDDILLLLEPLSVHIPTLHTTHDETRVVYTGKLAFTLGEEQFTSLLTLPISSGLKIDVPLDDLLGFRLTVPRDGATIINDVLSQDALQPVFQPMRDLFGQFGGITAPSDYPGLHFQLELMVGVARFPLGSRWVPGVLTPDKHIIRSPDPEYGDGKVYVYLPRLVLEYEQTEDVPDEILFRLKSWGTSGFDAPHDVQQGELVRMDPPIALYYDNTFAFGLDHAQVDLSPDHTPPEVLSHFGVDEDWRGIYVQSAHFYRNDKTDGINFNLAVRDFLLSFPRDDSDGLEVSLEVAATIFTDIAITSFNIELEFYNGQDRLTDKLVWHGDQGEISVPVGAILYVKVSGGVPGYEFDVRLNDGPNIWDPDRSGAPISRPPSDPENPYTLTVAVSDSAEKKRTISKSVRLHVTQALTVLPPGDQDGTPADRPTKTPLKPAQMDEVSVTPGDKQSFDLVHEGNKKQLTQSIRIQSPYEAAPTVTVREVGKPGTERTVVPEGARTLMLDVPAGTAYDIEVTWTGTSCPDELTIYFEFDRPCEPKDATEEKPCNPKDTISSHVSGVATGFGGVPKRIQDWLCDCGINSVKIVGHASWDNGHTNPNYNDHLSERRVEVVKKIVQAADNVVDVQTEARGHSDAKDARDQPSPEEWRKAVISADTSPPTQTVTLRTTLSRAASEAPSVGQPAPIGEPPKAPAVPHSVPDFIRRLGARVRLERNVPTLLEVSGLLDFDTRAEQALREAIANDSRDQVPNDVKELIPSAELGCCDGPIGGFDPVTGEPLNPEDGTVEFLGNVTYDTATRLVTYTLRLGSGEEDVDGFCRMLNERSGEDRDAINWLRDLLGAVLTFAPIMSQAAEALDPEAVGDWVVLGAAGASLGVPLTVVALDVFRTEAITFYGVELKVRHYFPIGPDDILDPTKLQDLSLTDFGRHFGLGAFLDFGVEFRIVIDFLGIEADAPIRVRYRALGAWFQSEHQDGDTRWQLLFPLLDTSRGYELELNDPAILKLPFPLGAMLQVTSVKLARFNPPTLELDLGFAIDMSVAFGGYFKVVVPLVWPDPNDPATYPRIIPSLLFIKIPGVIDAEGFIKIINEEDRKGLQGMMDLTLVSMQLRVTASLGAELMPVAELLREAVRLGTEPPSDPSELPQIDRFALGIFLGLSVQFPAPIPLWASGIAIYGFAGLFAANYKRIEDGREQGGAVGPALAWLIRAKGEPTRIVDSQLPPQPLWAMDVGHWGVGAGITLGTVASSIIINFGGMLILELPGPRILILVKVQVLATLPDLGGAELSVGVLGIMDLDFARWRLTIGILFDGTIEKLIEIKVPVEIFFNMLDINDWHLTAGTIREPATALILNLVRGYGYFILAGNGIPEFPTEDGAGLSGLSAAVGIGASVRLGEFPVVVEASADAHLGLTLDPLFLSGRVELHGQMLLLLATMQVEGVLQIEAPNPTFLHGTICGQVDAFLVTLEGCLEVYIGEEERELALPDLINGVYLQSYAPVLTAGQSVERPIDASLGHAPPTEDSDELPVVPIDSVPVIQLAYVPKRDSQLDGHTFTAPIQEPPESTHDGWFDVGAGRAVRFVLKGLRLQADHDEQAWPSGDRPPATWRLDGDRDERGLATRIELALFSRVPTVAARAMERSTNLNAHVEIRWKNLCKPAAPPACVLWTFCDQPFGPSPAGWVLAGTPLPDPPDTVRSQKPPTRLSIKPPPSTTELDLMNLLLEDMGAPFKLPARIVGLAGHELDRRPESKRVCTTFAKMRPGLYPADRFPSQEINIRVMGASGRPANRLQIRTLGRHVGLDCGRGAVVELVKPSDDVELTLTSNLPTASLKVFDARSKQIGERKLRFRKGEPATVQLRTKGIKRLIIAPVVSGRPPSRGQILPLTRDPSRDPSTVGHLLLMDLCIAHQPERPSVSPGDQRCQRLLQLPGRAQRPGANLPRNKEMEDYVQQTSDGEQEYLSIEVGSASRVTFFVALSYAGRYSLRIRQLNADDEVLRENSLSDLPPSAVSQVTGVMDGLPETWRDPGSPWRAQVEPAAEMLTQPAFQSCRRLAVTIMPQEECTKIQLRSDFLWPYLSQVWVAAIEVCSRDEELRAAHDERSQEAELATVTQYLGNDDLVPLLDPDRLYQLSVHYDVSLRDVDGNLDTEEREAAFFFRTDDRPPATLTPYVLGTTPEHEDRYHFYQDPMVLVFNDRSVLQLYAQYGQTLKTVLRAADGLPQPPVAIESLEPIPAQATPPYRATLTELVTGSGFPCAEELDQASEHGVFRVPIELRPLMAYNFEVELSDPYPINEGEAITPLYQRSFATSRYASLHELAAVIRSQRVRHRPLNGSIPLPGDDGSVSVATDLRIQYALQTAGEPALPAIEESRLTMYWHRPVGAEGFIPHAILIDAAEPLWRWRREPTLETVLDAEGNVIDPAFQRLVNGSAPSLKIGEVPGNNLVTHIVRSASGTRTLVFLSDTTPEEGKMLHLQLRRPANELYGLAQDAADLVALSLDFPAPWEEEDE